MKFGKIYLTAGLLLGLGGYVGIGSSTSSKPELQLSGSTTSTASTTPPQTSNPTGPVTIGNCTTAATGTWEDATPVQLNRHKWCVPQWADLRKVPTGCIGPGETNPNTGELATYGAHALALDPMNPGTVYLGTSSLGFWKTVDCGSSWVKINTGRNSVALDRGRNWSIEIDPTNSSVIYTTAGYAAEGLWKSTNGGIDWDQILPANIRAVTGNGFVERITIDPTNHLHLVAGFHVDCDIAGTRPNMFPPGTKLDAENIPVGVTKNGKLWPCMAETPDGGSSWTLVPNAIRWSGYDGAGQTMVNDKIWFYGANTPNEGIWLTTSGGFSPDGVTPGWTEVYKGTSQGSPFTFGDGVIYAGADRNVVYANLADLASLRPNSWQILMGGNYVTMGGYNGGNTMAAGGGKIFFGAAEGYYWASLTPGTPAEPLLKLPGSTEAMSNHSFALGYDPHHRILYSVNSAAGIWRQAIAP